MRNEFATRAVDPPMRSGMVRCSPVRWRGHAHRRRRTVGRGRPAAAAAPARPTIANGNAAYEPGSTSPPNQFNVLTLVSGGAASVNTSSLTIVTQPSSGSADGEHDLLARTDHLHPGGGHHRCPDPDLRLLRTGDTYPSAGNCTTATLTYAPATDQYFGGDVDNLAGVIEDLRPGHRSLHRGAGLDGDDSIAPVSTSIPSSDSGATVNSAAQFSVMMPVPKGFTSVPG